MNLVQHTKNALYLTLNGKSKLAQPDFKLKGMSGALGRMFLNNLCSTENIRYLEIGLWMGSTFCCALKDNSVDAVGIDNWSQFNGPKNEFLDAYQKYKGTNEVQILDADCFSIDVSKMGKKFNVYFYDGDHTAEAQEKAFTYFDPIFEDTFVAIVDDYKEPDVVTGTQAAFRKLGYTVLFQKEFYVPPGFEDAAGWWNGMLIAVLEKNKSLVTK